MPGAVLVHGGGATALADWVALWVKRGYAAISMDTCGCVPCGSPNPYFHPWPRHADGGPPGWGKLELAMEPVEEQWMYHALGAVILGHSLLRSFPQVDATRIGVTGISWGGVLTLLAAGYDPRFAFAIPVYGTGFLNFPESALAYGNPQVTEEQRQRWFELFDPARILEKISLPCFMLNGTNDLSFPLGSFWKTAAANPAQTRMLVPLESPHNHTVSWQEETQWLFAEKVLKGQPLPVITDCVRRDDMLRCRVSGGDFKRAAVCWSCGSGFWSGRKWRQTSATLSQDNTISCPLPRNTTAAYFTVETACGEQYSSMPYLAEEGALRAGRLPV